MRNVAIAVTVIVVLALIAGCSIGVQDNEPRPYIEATAGSEVPEGMIPAVIHELDGEEIDHRVIRIQLEPGRHTVRVLPASMAQGGGAAVRDLDPEIAGKRLVPLTIEIRPGEKYRFAARLVRFRTGILASDTGPAENSPWRTAVIPVVLSTGT